MCFAPQRRALFRHLNFQKWSDNGKSGPRPPVFNTDFKMCFAPQRRALFWHLNFQKWSENGVFCTFWLQNVLRATTACTFSTSQLPKVVRTWCVLDILTWKRASRHNGVHFFDISTSKSGPNLVCFGHFDLEMCFAPQRRAIFHLLSGQLAYFSSLRSHKSLEKHSVSRLSYLFAHLHLLSSDSFSSLIFSLLIFLFSLPLPCSAFHLSILSEVWLLNFLRLTIINHRLTRKIPWFQSPPTSYVHHIPLKPNVDFTVSP